MADDRIRTTERTGWPRALFVENLRHSGDEAEGIFAAYLHDAADEIERLRKALELQASPFILKTPQEKEINWEHVMREVNRRQKLAKEALL